MDNQRIFVWAALALVLFMNYQAWQRDYAPPPASTVTQSQSATPQNAPPTDSLPQLPTVTATPAQQPATPTSAPEQQPVENAQPSAGVVRVSTDVLSVDISTRGGELSRADLLKYAQVKNHPEVPVRLFSAQPPIYVAQSGL
ncbi:MAG TPA: membrane protein insertase YidC, partial [Steroidobacteraceae bacterium]|nr:membrane protein insertase YidC [Steroidobacteraceae bacterium]